MNDHATPLPDPPTSLAGRDYLRARDLTRAELDGLLDLGIALKAAQKARQPHQLCPGRTLGMVFHKASTRTRVSFEVGMNQLGGNALNLAQGELQLGRGETVRDTAMVLSRYLDAIMIRTFSQADIDELAEFARVPVINGLSDDHHPCQALADLLTLRERFGPDLSGVRLAYVGDANNVCRSLVCAAVIEGMDVVVAAPDAYQLDEPTVRFAGDVTAAGGGSLTLTADADEAARGAHALATDAFVSMGQEVETAERLRALMPGYRVDERRVALLAADGVVLHCLPAHYGQEIDESVLYGPHSAVWDQAENRLHAQKALLAALLAGSA
ncbi:MAG: ornithine carbamoyltransferase [Gaiellales bacterium]|nr:ornithine carbamoyltransferase [Gaiellales bacterium]